MSKMFKRTGVNAISESSSTEKGAIATGIASDVSRRRLRQAIVICIGITAFLCISIAAGNSWAGSSSCSNYVERIWESIKSGESFDDALEEVGLMTMAKEDVPDWVLNEVLDETWMEGAISSEGQEVILISREGDLEEIETAVTQALELKGWATATSGNDGGKLISTYVKTKGECTWLLVEYLQSGKETVAVLHTGRN